MNLKMKRLFLLFVLLTLGLGGWTGKTNAFAAAYPYQIQEGPGGKKGLMPVIGFIDSHEVQKGQTLLEIARKYGLGYNQIVLYHPDIDPWVPEKGLEIDVPTKWILPPTRHEEVVINIPEMRLYRFLKDINMVRTYPVGVGREGFETPLGESRVIERVENPSWTVPDDAVQRYGRRVVPPGPDNPLGNYWVGLSEKNLGIHGTDFPWSIGRMVSRGCIRLYPEHIEQFYYETRKGAKVEIIYEPVKIGVRDKAVFLEVHPDIYGRIPDMESHTWRIIQDSGLCSIVDPQKVLQSIKEKKGVPTPVSREF